MSFPGYVNMPASNAGAATTNTGVMAVSAVGAPTKQVASSAANARVNSKAHSPSPGHSPQPSLVVPPVTRATAAQISTSATSGGFASQLVAPGRTQARSLSPSQSPSQQSSGGALSPRMSARAAAAVGVQGTAHEVEALSQTMPVLPLQQSLEPVQEEQDMTQAAVWTPSVQELKEQLRAERSWWSSTSAAQVTSELAREREERTADIVSLKNDLKTQQVTLAQVARYLLGEKVSITELESTAGPQVAELEATLQELRNVVAEQQQNQELQANALREGLMSIHAQQASSYSAMPSAEVESLSASVDALHTFVNEQVESLSKEIAHERQARQVREAREAREGVGSFAISGGAQSDMQRQEFERLRAELTQELEKHRQEISEAERMSRRRDMSELRASADGPGAKALELHAQLAEELADVIRRSEQQRADMAQALDAERAARISEATDLRTSIETSIVDRTCASARGPADMTEDRSCKVQATRELAEERASRSRDVAESKAYTESMVKRALDRADDLEKKLAAAKNEWEQHAALDNQSASQVAAQAMAREFGTEVQNSIRESQEMIRYEFSARLSELELKMRHHLDFGGTQIPPQSEAEELSSRLEAIKAQLNAEIKKRLERTPGALLPVGTGEQSAMLVVKGAEAEQLQQSALEDGKVACR